MGDCGIESVKGLSVAYVAGEVSEQHVEKLSEKAKVNDPSFRGIDILLTSLWPKGICRSEDRKTIKPCGGGEFSPQRPDASAAALASILKPRYHFAGTEARFYARVPYQNQMTSGLARVHPTRFVGLGRVGDLPPKDSKKAPKWLHALGLVPLNAMTDDERTDVLKIPASATSCPYNAVRRIEPNMANTELSHRPFKRSRVGDRIAPVVPAWSAERAAQIESEEVRRLGAGRSSVATHQYYDAQRRHSRPPRRKGAPPRRACWFCLSTPGFETHLVASVGTEVYLALPKGPLLSGHILIVPIDHNISSLSMAPADTLSEIRRYLQALRAYFASSGQSIVAFEHNISRAGIMKHMHIQVVPVPSSNDDAAVQRAFESLGAKRNVDFRSLDADARIPLKSGEPYFLAILPSGKQLLHVPTRSTRPAPPPPRGQSRPPRSREGCLPSFGREAICGLIGENPKRVNWKNCVLTKEQEIAATEAFKKGFGKYAPAP
eukprot:g1189.t1